MGGTESATGNRNGSAAVVFCRECVLGLKPPAGAVVFCSAGCFGANLARHRDHVHLPERERERERKRRRGGSREAEDGEIRKPDPVGAGEDGPLHQHLITLEDALQEYRQSSGATVSS